MAEQQDIKIIIIDDDEDVRDFISQHVESAYDTKVTIRFESNGLLGLEALKAEKYDLIITDFLMPSMNGLEMLTNIRTGSSCNQATPVICVTGHLPLVDDKIPGHILNNTDFLEKPYELDEFLSLAHQYLK